MPLSLALAYDSDSHFLANVLSLLTAKSELKLTLFFCGETLEKLKRNFAKEVVQLRNLAADGRVEFLGGGFYDAILALFPSDLQILQLQKHKIALNKVFGAVGGRNIIEPMGYFSTSSAWEIGLIPTLVKCGFEYAFMPDISVQNALGRSSAVSGWFAVEEQGTFIKILTYSSNLTAALEKDSPVGSCVLTTLEDLKKTITDDFTAEYKLLSQTIAEQESSGKVALMSWSATSPSADSRDVLLTPEINLLHKKIIRAYHRANALGDSEVREKCFEKLLPAMSLRYFQNSQNGMKSAAVRFEAYQAVMKAEEILDSFDKFTGIKFGIYDFFLEGSQHVFIKNSRLECLIEPRRGGWVRSLAYLPARAELSCSMRDDGDVSPLFIDHILPADFAASNSDTEIPPVIPHPAAESVNATPPVIPRPNAESISAIQKNLLIHNRTAAFLNPYEVQTKRQGERMQILLLGEQVVNYLGKEYRFYAEKVFSIKSDDSELLVSISLKNNSFNAFYGEFATEICLGADLPRIDSGLSRNFSLPQIQKDIFKYELRDKRFGIKAVIESDRKTDFLIAPILGSIANAAPDTTQGLRIALFRKIELLGQESDVFHIRLKLDNFMSLLRMRKPKMR